MTLPLDQLDRLLYGRDRTPRIVAVESAGRERLRLYRRLDDERVVMEIVPFHPWFVLTTPPPWSDLADSLSARELIGPHPLRYLVRCSTWSVLQTVRERLREADAPHLVLTSPVEQYLVQSGRTLFKEMRFEDLIRLQFDIETTGLDPYAPDARLLMIAVTTNRGFAETIGRPGDDEEALLRRFTTLLRELDPDIIEGHNVFNFDLPYLLAVAARHELDLPWGRDGSAPRASNLPTAHGDRPSRRVKVGARSIPYADCQIYGRHVIDTYHQIQRYDTAGNLEHYGLKDVIAALGLTRPDRVFVNAAEMASLWRQAPERVAAYALDDVRDVEQLASLTLPTEFYQSQIVPWSFQQVATRGPGEKIDDVMVRSYLAAGHSLPLPEEPRPYPGGHTELRATGVFRPVVKADVESLYPSVMLSLSIAPRADNLGLYLPLLGELTQRRLAAKRQARRTTGAEQAYWQGIQASFKVLVNSFYGYLGYGRAIFSDFTAAEQVTLEGQTIIKRVVHELALAGATVIEVDTDGAYFVPPATVADQAAEEAFVGRVSELLPATINLVHDGHYVGMISLKLKNYALVEPSGAVILHGSALRSRREEPFLRDFIREASRRLVIESPLAVRDLYFETAARVQSRSLRPAEFARVENITDKTFVSDATRRLARAATGAVVGDRVAVYQRLDGSLARLDDYAHDEDVDYLLRRLRDMAGRLRELFTDDADFDYHCPPVTARTDLAALRSRPPIRQLSLFDSP